MLIAKLLIVAAMATPATPHILIQPINPTRPAPICFNPQMRCAVKQIHHGPILKTATRRNR